MEYPPSTIHFNGFLFFSNEPEAPALWADLAFRIMYIAFAVTEFTNHHAVFGRTEYLVPHFSLLFLSFEPLWCGKSGDNSGGQRRQNTHPESEPLYDTFDCPDGIL